MDYAPDVVDLSVSLSHRLAVRRESIRHRRRLGIASIRCRNARRGLAHHWHTLGLDLSDDDFTDAQAIAAIARITSGNFRLLQRLFTQIRRIMRINELTTITADVV